MEVLVFGLDNEDSVLARLRKGFPAIGFRKYDISMELEGESRRIIAIDTLKGIDEVVLLEDPQLISPGKAMAGSGAVMTLRILKSIGSIDSAKVIAVPENFPEEQAFRGISSILKGLLST